MNEIFFRRLEIPLVSPLLTSSGEISHLSHWLCELRYKGQSHFGEITNTPHRKKIPSPKVYSDFILENLEGPLVRGKDVPGPIAFCLDSLRYSIQHHREHHQLRIPINRLQSAQAFSQAPDPRVKIKLTPASMERDFELIQEGLQKRPMAKIILDANQGLSLQEFQRCIDWVEGNALQKNIFYFEEPVRKEISLSELSLNCPFSLAVDERFEEFMDTNPSKMDIHDYFKSLREFKVSVLVVKPSNVGGWQRIKEVKDFATTNGVEMVLSSSFESGVGMTYLGLLYRYLKLSNSAGFGTLPLLQGYFGFGQADTQASYLSIRCMLSELKT